MEKGYLSLILHAHLPFVRHPEHVDSLEEDWLFEAITETYIPLLSLFDGLKKDGVRFRLTLSLSPTLITMLKDPLLIDRYIKSLDKSIELSKMEVERTVKIAKLNRLANMYCSRFIDTKSFFTGKLDCDIVSGFVEHMEDGSLEIITCCATHGYLPALWVSEPSIQSQISIACDFYEKTFGRRTRGFWLPECGYWPGVEKYLKNEGVSFFIVDAHGLLHAKPRPKRGIFAPVVTDNGVTAFGRDIASSKEVWSAKHGYPGDYSYRDFYRDIGFDLELDYIKPYIQPNGLRKMTGIKYHKITGAGDKKDLYDIDSALLKASEHAEDFIAKRLAHMEMAAQLIDRPPLIVAPYDAELFGHWWHEGPDFLNFVFRKIAGNEEPLKTITPSEYLRLHGENQQASLSQSSWGEQGYSGVWIDEKNEWVYRELHKAGDKMSKLSSTYFNVAVIDSLTQRALKQAGRELLLAQSSDWAFMMKTGNTAGYAKKRTNDHLFRFNSLYEGIMAKEIDETFLSDIESKDNIFPDIDFRIFAKRTVSTPI